jgi:hypothetical protein
LGHAFLVQSGSSLPGLDPAIHQLEKKVFLSMDARVKPAHDEGIEFAHTLYRLPDDKFQIVGWAKRSVPTIWPPRY